jgi:hypothetical protein
LIDSGAEENLIDKSTYDSFKFRPELIKSRVKLYVYNSNEPLQVLGEFSSQIGYDGECIVAKFIVTNGYSGCLLGHSTSRELDLYRTRQFNASESGVNSVSGNCDCLFKEFPNVFNDRIGK